MNWGLKLNSLWRKNTMTNKKIHKKSSTEKDLNDRLVLKSAKKRIKNINMVFTKEKQKFDEKYEKKLILEKSLVPVDGKYRTNISMKNKKGEPSEEYYKWQFFSAIINSGLYAKDFLCSEVYFPKGNKNSAPIKMDGCIFDDAKWIEHYKEWREEKEDDAVEWLRKRLIGVIEFKKEDDKDIKKIFTSQVKPAMKESESTYCIGFYYNTERLYIFQKKNGNVVRYDESKNLNKDKDKSSINELSLDLTDGYLSVPSFENLL